MALWRASRASGGFVISPANERLEIIDYQTPLKAKRADSRIGKIDLLGLVGDRLAVIELKRASSRDSPLRAFLEGLAYCAIMESNLNCIRDEIVKLCGRVISSRPPILIVTAPNEYWRSWERACGVGYQQHLKSAVHAVAECLDVETIFLELSIKGFVKGLSGSPPQIVGDVSASVLRSISEPIGPPLS